MQYKPLKPFFKTEKLPIVRVFYVFLSDLFKYPVCCICRAGEKFKILSAVKLGYVERVHGKTVVVRARIFKRRAHFYSILTAAF